MSLEKEGYIWPNTEVINKNKLKKKNLEEIRSAL